MVVFLTHEGQTRRDAHLRWRRSAWSSRGSLKAKPIAEVLLNLFRKKEKPRLHINWKTAWWSGLVGGLGHVLLDGLIYPDMSPFWPFVHGTRMDVFIATAA